LRAALRGANPQNRADFFYKTGEHRGPEFDES